MKKHLLLLFAIVCCGYLGYSQAPYCSPSFNSSCTSGDQIINFSTTGGTTNISNLNSTCTGGNYFDGTAQAVTVVFGGTFNFAVQSGPTWSQGQKIWVDWNQDDDFDDPGEDVWTSTTWSTTVQTGAITVPGTALAGTTRMRVRCSYNALPTDPCANQSFGEVEDYSVTILAPVLTALAASPISVNCFGDTTATLAASIFGGTAPYTYLWSTGSTDSALVNMGAGTYSVIVTDAVSDMDTATIVVTEPTEISLTTSLVQALVCDYDISEAMATGAGGVALGSYSVDTTSSNFDPDTTSGGTVVNLGDDATTGALLIGFDFVFFGDTVDEFYIGSNGYVTFGQGYTNLGAQNIPNTFGPNNAIGLAWADLDPNNGVDGTISYHTIGSAPFRTLIVNFDDVPHWPGGTAETVTVQLKLHESTNCVEIHSTDIGSDNGTITQGIENGAGTEAYVYPGRNSSVWSATTSYVGFCPIDSTGLLYTWSSGQQGTSVFGLTAGVYNVTATDANGCEAVDSVTITNPVSALTSALNSSDISCFGFGDGMIDPTITGGVAPVVYTWSSGESTPSISNLGSGIYSVSATDAANCTIEVNNVAITEPDVLTGNVFNSTGVVCENDDNGSASVVIDGGNAPYTFLWSNGEVGSSATNLSGGVHNVEVTDANGCNYYQPVTIPFEATNPMPQIGNSYLNSNGGTITLSTQPTSYASYLWNTGATTQSITATQTGFYSVQVTNGNGCTGTDTAYVEIWPLGLNNDPAIKGISMFPNPAQDVLNFDLNADIEELEITIVDARGAIVVSDVIRQSGLTSFDVSQLKSGVYTVMISEPDAAPSALRLILAK